MPDFIDSNARDSAPLSWSDAFAALPQEAPPADGWSRIAVKLDAHSVRRGIARRERRMSWLIGTASAAALVVAAWSPVSQWLQGQPAEDAVVAAPAQAPGLRGPAAPVHAAPRAASAEPISAGTDGNRVAQTREPAEESAKTTVKPRSERSTRVASVHSAPPARTGSESPARIAASTNAEDATATAASPLENLKLQSAQLEALVALARDDRVGNGSSELLSSELDNGIAVIDTALSQTDLTEARKQELWQQRVDLLQQLAGMEATSRWLAAQGTSNDTMLVAVD